ncbi:hypothetical protein SAG0354_02780 [Streptococcus agalactiae GB00904]|nr:hypothetical protein SAG0042_04565 [Streptococcus agalactiae FSL F2-343]EPV10919.1 hypothetical protein SAG0330_01645 [Streptococcus agalactiae GB00561]EPV46680.1 hypothetical protein SAG0354_02780 [Streptococcus agalactiae GB00904]EPV62014.1 hypothetical protein SAG0360_08225 [Streptococcus agalactiae GB00923]EPV68812.1 hypothetical protein SAG0362_09375 [Streptococcus agalactiae GB00929]EPW69967.1 hypothetical protein SAG0096_06595 [Streptococcus agalactiae BSU447]EPW78321.1 hypothetical
MKKKNMSLESTRVEKRILRQSLSLKRKPLREKQTC